jgi:hypothetical protein
LIGLKAFMKISSLHNNEAVAHGQIIKKKNKIKGTHAASNNDTNHRPGNTRASRKVFQSDALRKYNDIKLQSIFLK